MPGQPSRQFPNPRPLKGLAFALLIGALLLTVGGCDAGRPAAATVNGHEVSGAELDDLLGALTTKQPTLAKQFAGPGDKTMRLDAVNTVLTYLIDRRLILESVRDKGVTISDENRTQGKTQLLTRFAEKEADQKKVFAALDKSTQKFLVDAEGAQLALQASFGKGVNRDAEAKAAFDANPGAFEQVCLSVITVATEPILALVQNRLASGEDFGAVAKDASIDNSKESSGDIGCIPAAQINDAQVTAALAAAKPGEVIGPYGGDGQHVLIKLDERKPADFAEAKAQIIASLPAAGQDKLNAFISKIESSAKVSVNPRYGHWDRGQRLVVRPSGPLPAPGSKSGSVPATTVVAG